MAPLANYRPRSVLEFVDDPGFAADPAALRELLQRFGPAPLHDPTPEELEKLAALRDAAESLLDVVASGRLPAPGELDELNAFLAVPVRAQLTVGETGFAVEATPVSAGWETVTRDLAGRLAELLVGVDPRRFKRCANPSCRRFFLDESRNRTRRWHDDACGNLVRVRRFRAAR